jgi:hypothetical protein
MRMVEKVLPPTHKVLPLCGVGALLSLFPGLPVYQYCLTLTTTTSLSPRVLTCVART